MNLCDHEFFVSRLYIRIKTINSKNTHTVKTSVLIAMHSFFSIKE